MAREQRRLSLRHPYLVRISIGRIPMGSNALRYSERVLAILRAGDRSRRLAVQGWLLLISTVNGFTVDETVWTTRMWISRTASSPGRRGRPPGCGEHGP